jgi:hypothetical protein
VAFEHQQLRKAEPSLGLMGTLRPGSRFQTRLAEKPQRLR